MLWLYRYSHANAVLMSTSFVFAKTSFDLRNKHYTQSTCWVILLSFTKYPANTGLFLMTALISSDSNNALLGKLWNRLISEEVLLFLLFISLQVFTCHSLSLHVNSYSVNQTLQLESFYSTLVSLSRPPGKTALLTSNLLSLFIGQIIFLLVKQAY